jgi:hypothetical protein
MSESGAQVASVHAAFTCGQCGAGLAFAGVRSQTCPYCASPNVVERPPAAHQPQPAMIVAFAGDVAAARAQIQRWLGNRTWFADARIKRARVEDLRGVYVPAYLYSAVAHTDYEVSIGEHYSETVEYEAKDEHGEQVKKQRTVIKSEYRPLSGRHVGYVTDVLVSASTGLGHAELQAIEPYDYLHLRRYTPAVVAGWIAEEFSRTADDCMRASRREAIEDVGMRLRRFMPGDSYSDLTWRTQVEWESLAPVLVPVWVLAVRYRDDKPALRVVINGQTGAVSGPTPLAWWKVTIAAVIAAAIVVLVIWALSRGEPPP